MAVIRARSWQEWDSFIREEEDDWAESRRYTYKPYLHESEKWRISHTTQNPDSTDDEGYSVDVTDNSNPLLSEPVIMEFDSKQAAIDVIKRDYWDGYTGIIRASRDEREYEAKSNAEIQRLMDRDD